MPYQEMSADPTTRSYSIDQLQATTELYEHIPLSSTQSLRLFDLFPSEDSKAPIRGSLREVDFGSGVIAQYEALSYVWHVTPGNGVIYCDGKALDVTANCLEALRALRLSQETRPLWIDAICIDQRENDRSIRERNNQVAIMGFIYGNAATVISWLGPSMRGLRQLVALVVALRKLDDLCERRTVSTKVLRPVLLQMRKSLKCESRGIIGVLIFQS